MQRATTRTPPIVSSADRTRDYALAVVSGEIVAGPHVRNACRRHLKDLEDGAGRGLWFDPEAAIRAFEFFEQVLKLSEGQFDGLPFQLHCSQAFIVGSIFGWMRADGTRRFRRAYVEQGKGNGKSPMAGGIGLYGMTADGEAGAQIYAAAAKREQAGILFADAVKMVRSSPALAKRVDFSGGAGREYNMAHHASGSFFRPVSRDTGKSGSGPRPYFVLADEIHELPDGKILEMLERGFKFRRQPLLMMITNSGSDRNSICWAEHEWAIKVAAGNIDAVTDPTFVGNVLDDSMFAYVCGLDDGDDPLTDPSCWVKANPLLGVTITEEYLAGVVAQAKNIPAKQNGILRLHFCVWTDAESAWLSREALEPLIADFDPAIHKGKDLFASLDLSRTRDITAAAFAVQTGDVSVTAVGKDGKPVTLKKPTFDAWIEAWTPGDTMQERAHQDKIPYALWAEAGFIHAPSGETISYRHVAQTLVEYDRDYKILMLAYDRYAYRKFEEEAADLGLTLPFVEHPQGGTKKGKPTDEMEQAAKRSGKQAEGLWFPSSLRALEEAILEKRIRFRRNPVLISAMMSAVVDQDKWDNRWLAKQKSVNKIDAAVAMVMAVGAACSMPPQPVKLVMFTVGGRAQN
jgi:phage terminase large subunit-like protein